MLPDGGAHQLCNGSIFFANLDIVSIIANMVSDTIPRLLSGRLEERLGLFPAVALLGPRQVGKTTLARAFAETGETSEGRPIKKGLYLDLENPVDREKLADARGYLVTKRDHLVVLDEIHRAPHLFQTLRGIIDERIRGGEPAGQFLLLGSASMDLLRQSGESLAGRIAYLELGPLDIRELAERDLMRLWIRGGFPRSFLAPTDADSAVWRESFIRTYLERDIPALGPRVPADTLRRFWTMLAHSQGGLWNAAALARSLAVDGKTIARYVDLLVDLLLVRRLPPFHANVRKRLAKSPKVYVRRQRHRPHAVAARRRRGCPRPPDRRCELGGLRHRDADSGGSGARPGQLLSYGEWCGDRPHTGIAGRPGLGNRDQAWTGAHRGQGISRGARRREAGPGVPGPWRRRSLPQGRRRGSNRAESARGGAGGLIRR